MFLVEFVEALCRLAHAQAWPHACEAAASAAGARGGGGGLRTVC
jgi:hypothetical protein